MKTEYHACTIYPLNEERSEATSVIDSEAQLKLGKTQLIDAGCMQSKKVNSFLEQFTLFTWKEYAAN